MRFILITLLIISRLCALTPTEIVALTKSDHSRDNLIDELEVYTEAREFLVTYKVLFPEDVPKPDPVIVKEKTVNGKFIVSEFTVGPKDNLMDLVMVVTYSKELQSYQKWLLNLKNQDLQKFIGVRIPDSTCLSWERIDDGLGDVTMIMGEHLTEKSVSWTESYYKDGKLSFSLSGKASKTK